MHLSISQQQNLYTYVQYNSNSHKFKQHKFNRPLLWYSHKVNSDIEHADIVTPSKPEKININISASGNLLKLEFV